MTTLYKLTDQNSQTMNDTTWGDGVTHHAADGPPVLCTPTVIHAYTDSLIALFMNPIHSNFATPLLWEADGEIAVDDGTKVGCKSLTTLHILPQESITTINRVAFGILAAKQVVANGKWVTWADKWLSNEDRSYAAAVAARSAAAHDVAYVAAYAAAAYAAAAYARSAARDVAYAIAAVARVKASISEAALAAMKVQ